jgi:putative Ca2+/H+ antiporter (TMEM165/GDT1 family)
LTVIAPVIYFGSRFANQFPTKDLHIIAAATLVALGDMGV